MHDDIIVNFITFCPCLVSVVHICGHYFNLTNLTESFSTDVAKIEQHLSQLDDPWLNPIREVGVVSLFNIAVFYASQYCLVDLV